MAPVTFTNGTHGGGTSSAVLTVIATTGAGDALVLSFGLTGSAPPTISTIIDTQGNLWVSSQSVGTNPALYVWKATGATKALVSGTDTLTVTFSGNTPAGWAHSGTDCPGVATADVNATGSAGAGTTASAAGTPAQSGETAVASFVWSNTGGAGAMNSPFTQLDQQHPTSSAFLTVGYDLNPASGVLLTASDTIVSTAWRANLLTLEASTLGTAGKQPPAGPRPRAAQRGFSRGQSGSPGSPGQAGRQPPPGPRSRPPARGRSSGQGGSATPPGKAGRQPGYVPPRRKPARGYSAGQPGSAAPTLGTANRQPPYMPPRRTPARALIQFTPIRPVTPARVVIADDGDAPWHIRIRRRRT